MIPPHKTWLTIGSFDGVHLGHQKLISQMVEAAHSRREKTAVLTFYPHPAIVLRGIQSPYYLTSPDEKADLLLKLGIDEVVTIPFTQELAGMNARQFIQIIRKHLEVTHLWVGYDFALGHNREGNIPTLISIGQELGFQVSVFDPVQINGETISSRQIRRFLGEGQVGEAARLLGRYYDINGSIAHGDSRGRLLGIPTTNMDYDPSRLLPLPGIYITLAHHAETVFKAVTNIGTNPTFINTPMTSLRVETHLLDFTGDLYETQQKLEFVQFVRLEEKFNSVQALKSRIEEDIRVARIYFPQILK